MSGCGFGAPHLVKLNNMPDHVGRRRLLAPA